ncbi:uncharacterized protein A4U43_C09F12350 [Asparagus officinalis]|uniref:TF-B3 domain-containing protein n=1 Tax=Asparagus officinalis TaxID=4686 RepID=A0A5P1E7H8_ASPOF|nr:B3 domain-containing protein Os11g0197600-like [Asparagus officinalis]ONK58419.1 uncharacterized protein A4U43_C09F12350 [Asparagus officinalis]
MANSKPHYFFKIFLPNQSSNSLRIPPAFGDHIEVESNRRVYLKGQSGSVWGVNMVKNCDGFSFEDGWKDFVVDHSLIMGDLLIFRYNGSLRFEVLVFDSSACEKRKAFLARPSMGEEIEDVEETEQSKQEMVKEEEEEEEEDNKPLVHFAKRKFDGNLKKRKKKQFPSYGDQSNSGQPLPKSRDLATPKQEQVSYSPPSPFKFTKDTQMQKNGECMHGNSAFHVRRFISNKNLQLRYRSGQVSRCTPHSTKGSTSKKSSKSVELVKSDESACRTGSVYRMRALISQRRPVTTEEVERALQRALKFQSEHPFAVSVMQDSYVYTSFFMCLPTWFVRKHLPKENAVLTVSDPNGKQWKMTYICYNSHGALSGGWGKFTYAHNLEKHDVCIFEFIDTDHLKVHIYRVLEEITPLLRPR